MKKGLVYIIIGVAALAILMLVFLMPQKQEFDKRVTLDRKYKKPYDLSITFNKLPLLFDNSVITVNRKSPLDWYDEDSVADGKTVFFVITQHFNPNKAELNKLINFVKLGNQVFISTPYMNTAAKEYFSLAEQVIYNPKVYDYYTDSGSSKFAAPPFNSQLTYFNPGFNYLSYFTDVDSSHYSILSENDKGHPDFVQIKAGKGSFFFQANPFLFSNYFLLYRNNIRYLEKVASLMPADKHKIVWDEYYIYRLSDNERPDTPSMFHVLLSVPAFRWALIIGICLLVLYILLNVKLAQRFIPVWEKPKNESLDFTKIIGRLYFEKGDNTNLAKKMTTYLLEYIRNKYFISTTTLNDEFIKNLVNKTGYNEDETKKMVGNMVYVQAEHKVSEQQLVAIYESFSKFYKHTS